MKGSDFDFACVVSMDLENHISVNCELVISCYAFHFCDVENCVVSD